MITLTRSPARLSRLAALASVAGLATHTALNAQAMNNLTAAASTQDAQPTLAVTIYSSAEPGGIPAEMYRPTTQNPYAGRAGIPGYALVRDDRSFSLNPGKTTLKVTDVAALIDPTTVSFRSLTDPVGTRVGEQNFQFDLVSNDKLLEKFIDQRIVVDATRGSQSSPVQGTLLSAQGGLVLKRDDGSLEVVNAYSGLQLPKLPDGLITRPTLVWDVYSQVGGEQTARMTYQTEGITWWTDYNLVYTETDDQHKGTLDLAAWVSILNKSGATYPNAKLKLVAGQVQRAQPQYGQPRGGFADNMVKSATAAPEFSEKSFFEYHLYTLDTPTTIPDSSTKQIELFPTARNVPVQKVLVYDGQQGDWWGGGPMLEQSYGVESKTDVDVYLKFKNAKEGGLGMPLPAGRIRVSKLDTADGNLEFIGEDTIKHTPREEEVLIRLGQSFDVVGSRTQTDFSVDNGRRTMTETIEVEVRNRKDQHADVIVQERMLRWTNWEFIGRDVPNHTKLDARTVHFPVSLDANQSKKVKFTVRYTW